MHISWSFLDKKKAAIEAVEAYSSMQYIIQHTDEEILEKKSKMGGVGSPNPDGMPHAQNPKAGEERLVQGIEEIDILKERYRQAVEYMAWFKPAWNQLSEDDQFVLETFFGPDTFDAAGAVARHFDIERSSAYSKRKRAVDRLTQLLYGKS